MPSIPHTGLGTPLRNLDHAPARGRCSEPLAGASHRDEPTACGCGFLPAWGVQNVGGGFERVLPQGKGPPLLLRFPSLGKK